MELVPENFPRPPAHPPQTWNAYDDMVTWEKEIGYTGDDLYRDWVASWLCPEYIRTDADSEPAHSASGLSGSTAASEDSERPLGDKNLKKILKKVINKTLDKTLNDTGAADATADLDCSSDKMYITDRANKEDSLHAVSSCDAILQDIYDQHLLNAKDGQNEHGVTLMMQNIPYRWTVEPDLLDLLRQTCEIEHVDYIYLPTTIEGISCRSAQTRNKGYCFIHFSVASTSQAFASQIHDHVFPASSGEKRVIITLAKFQGLRSNLMGVLDIHAKKWRPKDGFAYIRTSKEDLVCVGLLPLRKVVKRCQTMLPA
jgi:hypothetical protein